MAVCLCEGTAALSARLWSACGESPHGSFRAAACTASSLHPWQALTSRNLERLAHGGDQLFEFWEDVVSLALEGAGGGLDHRLLHLFELPVRRLLDLGLDTADEHVDKPRHEGGLLERAQQDDLQQREEQRHQHGHQVGHVVDAVDVGPEGVARLSGEGFARLRHVEGAIDHAGRRE
eukprot:6175619-Pleurochrysis_carterae.AAC.1